MKPVLSRIASIDIFRAITMFLMVFVNDLDEIVNIPEQWKHAAATEDRLGFADTIFPAFLFILGLSLPFALQNRINKGKPVVWHILSRTLALLIMGFFHVNLESYHPAALLPRPVWEILITIGFFLIWLDYDKALSKTWRYGLQGSGMALLVLMALVFTGITPQGETTGLHIHWWGILGLIGWAYCICAFVYYFSKGRPAVLIAAWLFFFLFDVAMQAGWLSSLQPVKQYIWIAGNGSLPALGMAGVVTGVLYNHYIQKGDYTKWMQVMAGLVFICLAAGFLTRPYGGISKLHDTPAWVAFCTGISMLVYMLMVWLADIQQKENWFRFFKPAGTSTLTCYLIPYLLYSLMEIVHFRYPAFLSEGIGGFMRSIGIACLAVLLTGLLERKKLRLKI